MKSLHVLFFALVVFITAKASAQEWEYSIECEENESPWIKEAKPLQNGNIVVTDFTIFPMSTLESYQPGLLLLSPNGEELARKDFNKPAFWGDYPHVLSDVDGTTYMMVAYNPDHDSTCANYFKNFDNPPDYSILGLYKLDEQLSIVESHEFQIPVDTIDAHFTSSIMFGTFNEYCGGLSVFSAFIEEGSVVGGYIKKPGFDYFHPHGNDSIFFFRIGLDGTLINHVGYEMDKMSEPGGGGLCWGSVLHGYNIVKVGDSYVCFLNGYPITGYRGETSMDANFYPGYAYFLDRDFNIADMKHYHQRDGLGDNYFSNAAYIGSHHNTVYLSCDYFKDFNQGTTGCALYEYGLNDEKAETLPILRYIERSSASPFDDVADIKGVSVALDNSLYFAYELRDGVDGLSIEHLTPNFDTISTLFYRVGIEEALSSRIQSIEVTRTGDLLMTFVTSTYPNWWTSIAKFPSEAFVGIEEAHASGLKVAIAYPNPGGNTLNIRTGLQNARVEVYDLNGKLVCNQEITDAITSINAENWPSGTYVWKVMANGKEAECGKWIKNE